MLTFLASPWNYIYKAEMLEKDPHWYKKNVMGTGPFKLGEYVPGLPRRRQEEPRLLPEGPAVPRRVPGAVHHRRGGAGGGAARRARGGRFRRGDADDGPGEPAPGDRRQAGHPEEQLDVRPHHRVQPREEAVRRPARAAGAEPGDRSPGGRARPQRVHRVRHGGRDQPARRAVRDASRGAGEDPRLLAGHREEPDRGEAAAEGGRCPGRVLVRVHATASSPALSVSAST